MRHVSVTGDWRWSRGEFGREERRGLGITATAAVVATAATVASTGLQVAKAAGAFDPSDPSGTGGGYVPPALRERLFARGTQDILNSERSILADSLAQGKFLEPEMYKALGLEPVYDREEDPEFANLSNALSGKQTQLNDVRMSLAELQGRRGKGKKGRQKQGRQLKRQAKQLNKEIAALASEVEQRGAVGRRVVGFKALPGVADPTGSAGGAFGGALDEFNRHLGDALAGKEPLDPTLKSTFDERERTLRERLRRQMGPDYETSTAGSNALANFDRERSEAYAQYNRQSIAGFSQLAESRAGALADLTRGRLANLAFPAAFRAELGSKLEGLAEARRRVSTGPMTEREMQMEADRAAQLREDKRRAEKQTALETLAGSVSGASTTIGGVTERGLGGASSALLGESVSPEAGGVGPPTRGLAGVGGSLGGGKIQSLLGR